MMNFLLNYSLKTKILLLIFVAVLASALPLNIFVIQDRNSTAIKKFENEQKVSAELVAQYLVSPLSFDDYEGAAEILQSLDKINNIRFAFILNNQNELIATYPKKTYNLADTNLREGNADSLFVYQTNIAFKDFQYGKLYIISSKAEINEELREYLIFLILFETIIFIFVFILALQLQKYISSPILNLSSVMSDISSKKDFSHQIIYKNNDEIGQLYDEFNKLLLELNKYQISRDEAEQKLKELNTKLEELVEIRTDELIKTNSVLVDEIESRKTIENELAQLNTAKDRFFSILAHDLKNPLSGVVLSMDIIKMEINDPNPNISNLSKIISTLKESVLSMAKLIDELLQWSTAGNSSTKFEPEMISLSALVKDSIALLKLNAEQKNIFFDVADLSMLSVFGDKNMLLTAIRNILANAVKFTPIGGLIQISAFDNGDYIEIEILDNGIGMSEEQIHSLFRLDAPILSKGTANETGTGLGLVLCKQFIDKNGGNIYVESEIGKGTKFIILLRKE